MVQQPMNFTDSHGSWPRCMLMQTMLLYLFDIAEVWRNSDLLSQISLSQNNIVSDVFISGFSPSSCGSYKDEAQEQAKEETEELTNQPFEGAEEGSEQLLEWAKEKVEKGCEATDAEAGEVVLILGFLGLLNFMDLNFMNFAGFNFGVFGILQKELCAEKERDERRSGNRRMDRVSLELNDQKRLATSGRNFATAYTLQFGTCTFPYNFTGCQDLAKQKNYRPGSCGGFLQWFLFNVAIKSHCDILTLNFCCCNW
ncbi:photosystem I reaction center subunit N, chloroplastic [Artemisia annua]|uniref:Photosystem I reaction center subunit N, chloroplastic n=1 Tax=Artemisia annua TaxID=35608 RepID=A0A2U1KWV4_ARTAN|nr:photosystem I reaction center subunit N, chloroplastic [Artemisia annua]